MPVDTDVLTYASPEDSPLRRVMIRLIEGLTGKHELLRLYREYASAPEPGDFWEAAIERLHLDIQIDRGSLDFIPATGPLIVVANHPFGVVDGLTLSYLLSRRRSDFRLLVHWLLLRVPEPRPWLLPVDFTASRSAQEANAITRSKARALVADGGALILFPSATVSTSPHLGKPAIDPEWQPFPVTLAQRTGAPIVPVYFAGENSPLFQLASHVSMTLRLSLLFHELSRRLGTSVHVAIGDPIPATTLSQFKNRNAAAAFLRETTYALGGRTDLATSRRLEKIAGTRERPHDNP